MNIEKLLLVFGLSFTLMTGTSLALEKVTLQLKWHHQFQFAGYYAAFEKGYYKDVGLNVSIKPGGPTVKVDQEVLSGRADYGVLASELIGKRVQGKKAV
ncbi:MAG: ABC transporter substrate-binding protein, partial [Deltaproteobacteria bacterium]|nr:ABC transporter substrate-binding protein [Deltaproteobacteria bacterium]